MVIFLHIARTGGLTMRSLIRRSYSPIKSDNNAYLNLRHSDLDTLAEKRVALTPSYVHAHFLGYGVHRHFSTDTEPRYITMLRHPTDRLRSLLTYGTKGGFSSLDHAVHDFFSKTRRSTHTELQTNILERAGYDNMMTRTLGSVDGTAIPRDTRACTVDTFELAVHRLLTKIDVVMITERFDESVLLLQKVIGLRNPWYRQINNTKPDRLQAGAIHNNAPSHQKALTDLKEYAVSRDHYDCRLYELALEHFDYQLSREYSDVQKDLLRYRRLNKFFGSCYKLWDSIMPVKLFYKN